MTERQIEDAQLHATVWEAAADNFKRLADREQLAGRNPEPMIDYAAFAQVIASSYRRVVS